MCVCAQGKAVYPREREAKKEAWSAYDCDCDLSSPASPAPRRSAPKAVDEDLYKISPNLLRQQAKRVSFSQLLSNMNLFELVFVKSANFYCDFHGRLKMRYKKFREKGFVVNDVWY